MQWPQDKRKSGATSDLSPVHDPDNGVHLRQDVQRSGTRLVKSALIGLTATGIVIGMTVPAALASSTQVSWSKKDISFSSYVANGVSGYTENGTTYMPVWYVLQALQKSGYKTAFNGKVLSITSPANVTPNTAGLSVGSGNLAIEINGQVVKRVNSEVRIDPASRKSTQFIPIYYIQQILSALSFYNSWNGTDWTGRPVTVTMQGNQVVQEGQLDAFALELQNPDESFFFPPYGIRWSVTGTGQASIDKNTGIFSASSPGTYNVTASVAGFHWTKSVTVYGQAVGVKLSSSTPTLTTDGASSSTITVQAVDSDGQLVQNFTGTVQLSIPVAGGTFLGGITSGTENEITAYLYNGVGTVTLNAPSSVQTSETITSSDMTSASQSVPQEAQYGSLTMNYQAPVVTKIGITPSSTSLSSNTYTPTYLQLNLEDQNGNPITNSSTEGIDVTLTISGPASFASGTTYQTMTEYVSPGTTGISIPIYAIAGQSGQVTVTASGAGVSGSAELNNGSTTGISPLAVSSSTGTLTSSLTVGSTILPAGTSFTLYTVTVQDANGNPLPQADTLYLSDSTTSSSGTVTSTGTTNPDGLSYYSVSGDQPYQPLPLVGSNTYSVATSAATGKAQFIVFNTGNVPATTSITIRDLTTDATVSTSIGSN